MNQNNTIAISFNGMYEKIHPSREDIINSLSYVARYFTTIKTYYPQFDGKSVNLLELLDLLNVKGMIGFRIYDTVDGCFQDGANVDDWKLCSIWTSSDYSYLIKQIENYPSVTTSIIVGNEQSNKITDIKFYIEKFKEDLLGKDIKIGTAQTPTFWISNAQASSVAELSDFIGANIFPDFCWNNSSDNHQPLISCDNNTEMSVEDGFNSFISTYDAIINIYNNKKIIITETGWPTDYKKINYGSECFIYSSNAIINAKNYVNKAITWSKEKNVDIAIFQMFDSIFAVDDSSLFNYHFGMMANPGCSNIEKPQEKYEVSDILNDRICMNSSHHLVSECFDVCSIVPNTTLCKDMCEFEANFTNVSCDSVLNTLSLAGLSVFAIGYII